MRVFHRHLSRRHVIVFTGELLVICGWTIVVARGLTDAGDVRTGVLMGSAVTVLYVLGAYYCRLYDLTAVRTGQDVLIGVLRAVAPASVIIAVLLATMPGRTPDDAVFPLALGGFLAAILAWRLAFTRFTRLPLLGERILIIGTGRAAQTVARAVLAQRDFPYRIFGFIDDDPARIGMSVVNPSVVGTPADIERIVAAEGIDRIVVGPADRRGHLPVRDLLRAKLRGVRVEDVNTLYERLTERLLIEDLRPSALIFSDGFGVSRMTRFTKRVSDIALSLVGLALASPVMAVSAVAIVAESGFPILYSQERVGARGRVFTLHKFRSMTRDAERGTPVWARQVDHRVTAVGRIIRHLRIDELPQLWNVLRGDMSIVGPRPERPFFVARLAERFSFYEHRHTVKPGITGWAQVKYSYGGSMEDALEKLRYDLYYVKHMSMLFDLSILFDTVKVVLIGKGAR